MGYKLPIKVFDFFSGCGGTSKGFQNTGMDIVFALDNDPDCQKTYLLNFPGVQFFPDDIKNLPIDSLNSMVNNCKGHAILFSGCAPCQPFTRHHTQRNPIDTRRMLLRKFLEFIQYHLPDFVFIENVPGLKKIDGKDNPFYEFEESLHKYNYQLKYDIIKAQDYGVPQRRRRLVLIASHNGIIDFPPRTHGPNTLNHDYATIREWIEDLPPIEAGQDHPQIPNHRAANLSPLNIERIVSTPEGGDWRDWPEHLRLDCRPDGYTGYTDVYGRMWWDKPATGLTTRCISLSNGRFGHPVQNRAISVREAACIQTFPIDFHFMGNLNSMAKQIGNAVPPLLAQRFGENFTRYLTDR